jgi:hypothetical protein
MIALAVLGASGVVHAQENRQDIQRLKGGSAPTNSCLVPGEVGQQILVPYSADYFFFRSEQ